MSEVKAPIAGFLSAIEAVGGERVQEGDLVCQVECMKSFFACHATKAGIVRYKVNLGESVGQDEVIAVIEEG